MTQRILLVLAFFLLGVSAWSVWPQVSQAQLPCPGPILIAIDPTTGKQIDHLDFGNVPIGQTKTLDIMIANPPQSPCQLSVKSVT